MWSGSKKKSMVVVPCWRGNAVGIVCDVLHRRDLLI
jgi:hypothetical protein